MIEFQKKPSKAMPSGFVYRLLINGKLLSNVKVVEDKARAIVLEIDNVESAKRVLAHKWTDFPNSLVGIRLVEWRTLGEFNVNVSLGPNIVGDLSGQIVFWFGIDMKTWDQRYSFLEYEETFLARWKTKFDDTESVGFENDTLEFDVFFDINLGKFVLLDKINEFYDLIVSHHEEVKNELVSGSRKSFLSVFSFPDEITVSCQQYLLYFVRFLQDIGIETTSSLQESAGKILFSVTPTNEVDALDKICEALVVYLDLPSSPIVYGDSMAVTRLHQQIENLQHSQKMAARELQLTGKLLIAQSETIHEKNIIISQKDSTIEQQNKIIEKITSKSIMMDSLENKEELEEIFDGLKIGESKFLKEQLGIHLNPAKVLKTVGKKFRGKEENISIINSEENIEQ